MRKDRLLFLAGLIPVAFGLIRFYAYAVPIFGGLLLRLMTPVLVLTWLGVGWWAGRIGCPWLKAVILTHWCAALVAPCAVWQSSQIPELGGGETLLSAFAQCLAFLVPGAMQITLDIAFFLRGAFLTIPQVVRWGTPVAVIILMLLFSVGYWASLRKYRREN